MLSIISDAAPNAAPIIWRFKNFSFKNRLETIKESTIRIPVLMGDERLNTITVFISSVSIFVTPFENPAARENKTVLFVMLLMLFLVAKRPKAKSTTTVIANEIIINS